jgi:hypothetical protein
MKKQSTSTKSSVFSAVLSPTVQSVVQMNKKRKVCPLAPFIITSSTASAGVKAPTHDDYNSTHTDLRLHGY